MRLRPSRPEELDALHSLWTDPAVRRYLWDGEVISREKSDETLRAGIESFARDGFGLWSVLRSSDRELAGFCGLRRFGDHAKA